MSVQRKGRKAPATQILTVLALFDDARSESRVERLIRRHSRVKGRTYLEEDDKNQVPRVRVAVYLVETDDARLLKSSLKALANHRSGVELLIR